LSRYSDDLSAPDSLLADLKISYERREIDQYSNLFAEDFTFVFQPGEGADEFPDGWAWAQDSLSTESMFRSFEVVEIRLSWTWDDPVDALWKGEPTLRVRLNDVRLDVEKMDGVIYRVTETLQDFHFRLGKESLGEDSRRYYIVGWQEFPKTFAPAGATPDPETTSWGYIKGLFL